MEFLIYALLKIVIDENKSIFFQDSYLILNSKKFPFFFIKSLKSILEKKYNISTFIKKTFKEIEEQSSYDTAHSFFSFSDQSISKNIKEGCYIVFIEDKNDIANINKILKKIKKNWYYIFIINSNFKKLIKPPLFYYTIETTFQESNKTILYKYLQECLPKKNCRSLDYFFNSQLKTIEKYFCIEDIIKISQYIPNIKKVNISKFLNFYIKEEIFITTKKSIFDLSTVFFQKNSRDFWNIWNTIKKDYSIEFWYHFWFNQLWYAGLAIINKNNIQNIYFYKKVNRWFIKYGILKYSLSEIYNFIFFLKKIGNLNKKKQTSLHVELEAFFNFFLKNIVISYQ